MNLQLDDSSTSCEQASPQAAQSSSCGKAILIGEHAVVYGTHAIALPLKQMRMFFEIEPIQSSNQTNIILKLGGQEASSRLVEVIPEAISLIGEKPFSMKASGHSSLPIGAGLGSSASLCVAILRALATSLGKELDTAQLSEFSNRLEARFHGNPSGLDAAVVAYESCIYFSKSTPVERIELSSKTPSSWEFLLIDSKMRASTKTMIDIARPSFTSSNGEQLLAKFEALANQAKENLTHTQHYELALALNEAHLLLKQVGVVPDPLDDMIHHCRRLGASAAKITGAGGGGTIICLLDPKHADEQTARIRSYFKDYPSYRISL